jgi:hypothetical protein
MRFRLLHAPVVMSAPAISHPTAVTSPNTASNNGLTSLCASRGSCQGFENPALVRRLCKQVPDPSEVQQESMCSSRSLGRRLRALQSELEAAASAEFNLGFESTPHTEAWSACGFQQSPCCHCTCGCWSICYAKEGYNCRIITAAMYEYNLEQCIYINHPDWPYSATNSS